MIKRKEQAQVKIAIQFLIQLSDVAAMINECGVLFAVVSLENYAANSFAKRGFVAACVVPVSPEEIPQSFTGHKSFSC